MKLRRIAIACVAPIALHFAALSAPAMAQAPTDFEQAMLAQLDDATRAEVEQRATGGNTVLNVIGTILLNNYQAAGPRNAGAALTVVAVDFGRGTAVVQRASNVFELIRFDPRTLRVR